MILDLCAVACSVAFIFMTWVVIRDSQKNEVVRCKDCKGFMEYTRDYARLFSATEGADGDCYIRVMNSDDKQFCACKYDDFCSYGERKEE